MGKARVETYASLKYRLKKDEVGEVGFASCGKLLKWNVGIDSCMIDFPLPLIWCKSCILKKRCVGYKFEGDIGENKSL